MKISQFHKAHGHGCPPTKFVTDDGFKLGNWVNVNRKLYKTKQLHDDKIIRLEAIQFVWSIGSDS